jgi:hypothetical protein
MTMESNGSLKFSVDRSALAPPGISGDLVTVETVNPGPEGEGQGAGAAKLNDRSLRMFELHCVFQRDSAFANEVIGFAHPNDGTSFFTLPDGPAGLTVHAQGTAYEFVTNEKREFSGIRAVCQATSLQDARAMFLGGITPMLDHLAYVANVPLIVGRTVCIDRKNSVTSFSYTSPYPTVNVGSGIGSIRAEMVPIYSLYREAKNSASTFYRLLCYYKILEGIYNKLRREVNAKAKEMGVTLKHTKELIPEHSEFKVLGAEFAQSPVGRSVKDYFDNVLQKSFRDAVAHFMSDEGISLNPSDPEIQARFANIILPAELCCRVAIDQQERYYAQLYRA